MKICTLASGSSGNASLFIDNNNAILVDAGLSGKAFLEKIGSLGLSPENISGIFITHGHIDHISGLSAIMKKCNAKVFASKGTIRELLEKFRKLDIGRIELIEAGKPIPAADFMVTPFVISHDSEEPFGYAVTCGDKKAAVATDMGLVTDSIKESLKGCGAVIIETNHDIKMLEAGPYPYKLKKRILGAGGHLSNEASAELGVWLAQNGTGNFLLAHLSEENNYPDLALMSYENAFEKYNITGVTLKIAPRREISEVLEC